MYSKLATTTAPTEIVVHIYSRSFVMVCAKMILCEVYSIVIVWVFCMGVLWMCVCECIGLDIVESIEMCFHQSPNIRGTTYSICAGESFV